MCSCWSLGQLVYKNWEQTRLRDKVLFNTISLHHKSTGANLLPPKYEM